VVPIRTGVHATIRELVQNVLTQTGNNKKAHIHRCNDSMKLSLLVKEKDKMEERKREERELLPKIGTGLLQIAISFPVLLPFVLRPLTCFPADF
jgi:hypothetical protein